MKIARKISVPFLLDRLDKREQLSLQLMLAFGPLIASSLAFDYEAELLERLLRLSVFCGLESASVHSSVLLLNHINMMLIRGHSLL